MAVINAPDGTEQFVEEEPQPASEQPDNTEAQNKAVNICATWFEDDRAQRQSVEKEWTEADKIWENRHWDLLAPDGNPLRNEDEQSLRPCTVDNVTWALIDGLVAEFAQPVDLIDLPKEDGDDEVAQVMTDLKEHLMYTNRLDQERLEYLQDYFLYGTAIWHVFWDPFWRGGAGPNRWLGEVRWQHLPIKNFYPDARLRTSDLSEATRIHKAVFLPVETVAEMFPKYGNLVQAEINDSTEPDDDTEDDDETASATTLDASSKGMTLLVETWYKGRPLLQKPGSEDAQSSGIHVIWWAGEHQRVYLGHANYVNYNPGEDAQYPFVLRRRYKRRNGPWGYGEAYYQKSQQMALNKSSEQILEGHLHHALGRTYYEKDAMDEPQQRQAEEYGMIPGIHLPVNNVQGIKEVQSQGVPASLQMEPDRIRKAMESAAGRFDVAQGRTPGSVTAFRALELLAQRSRIRMQNADVALRTGYEDCGNLANHLIARNYTEERAYMIGGRDPQKKRQRNVFRPEILRKVFFTETNEVAPYKTFLDAAGNFVPPGAEGTYEIYSPEFDTFCKTTTQTPSDKLWNMELAKELFTFKLLDPETFFFVLENGRFPPWQEVAQRMLAHMQAMQPAAAGVPLPGPTPGGGGGNPVMDQIRAGLSELPEEEQEAVLTAILTRLGGGGGAPAAGPG